MSDALRVVNPEPMTATEARAVADEIRSHLDGARGLILELHERRGWAALGYASWADCVVKEFDQSKSYLYRQLDAAKIEREITEDNELPMGNSAHPIPERQLRPLKALPEGERKSAFKEAVESTNGKPTAKAVQEAVDRRIDKPKPSPKPKPEPPAPQGFQIAEVTEPEPEPEPVYEPGAGADEDADDTEEGYLESFPLRAKLGDRQRRIFDSNALVYRDLNEHRKTFQHHATRVLNARDKGRKGPYSFAVSRFLKTEGPTHWILCAAPEYGGCGGTGELPSFGGECPECFGRGFKIK
jgi:hypothetical protein